MGLLDWLTDGIGSSMTTGGSGSAGPLVDPGMGSQREPMVNATSAYSSPGSAPLSPAELPQAPPPAPPAPPAPAIDPATSDIGGGVPPGGTGAPPTPMPMPRPPGAPGPTAAPAPAVPPLAATPPGPPTSLAPPPSPMPPPDSGPAAPPVQPYHLGDQTALGRSLGINPNNPRSNNFNSAMAGLGEGLTAAGNSKGKSGGQAFASGVGGAITGASKQDNAQYDQRLKALHLAVQAQAEGDKAGYNKNYAEYLKGKLANDAASGKSGGKASAWNKPDSQKFIDAQNAMSKDPDIRASEKMLEQVAKDKPLDDPIVQQARAAHAALVQQKQGLYLTGVGLNPATIQKNMQTPPGTPPSNNPDGSKNPGNPHVVNTQAEFDTYVKPGQAYVVPSGPHKGEIYIRKAADVKAPKDDAATEQETPSTAPPSAPEPPGPAPGTTAEEPEEP